MPILHQRNQELWPWGLGATLRARWVTLPYSWLESQCWETLCLGFNGHAKPMSAEMKQLIYETPDRRQTTPVCVAPLNVKTEESYISHSTVSYTAFQMPYVYFTYYFTELLHILTITWFKYLAKYLLNNWWLLLPWGSKFALRCLWEGFHNWEERDAVVSELLKGQYFQVSSITSLKLLE